MLLFGPKNIVRVKATANETLVSRPDFLEIPCGGRAITIIHYYEIIMITNKIISIMNLLTRQIEILRNRN